MRDRVSEIVILGEDEAQQNLFRAFFDARGGRTQRVRFRAVPHGKGSGEKHVRDQLAIELRSLKACGHARLLVVIIDADTLEVDQRLSQLLDAIDDDLRTIARGPDVLVVVPKRAVETWGRCLLCDSPNEQTSYRNPSLTAKEWRQAGRTLFDWSRPNASVPDKCVDSLRRCLPALAEIPRPG